MFVRAKTIGSRRYVYLVEGVREGARVRQRTVCYLGPVSKLASGGIPVKTRREADKRFKVDWRSVNDWIGRIPLTFEEMSEARRARYASIVRTRPPSFRRRGGRPRARGELSALSKLAAARFREMFEEIADGEYRMRGIEFPATRRASVSV